MSLELSLICLVNVVIFLHEEIQYLAALISEPRTFKRKTTCSPYHVKKRDYSVYEICIFTEVA